MGDVDAIVLEQPSSAPAPESLPIPRLRLINNPEDTDCAFWIGLTRPGALSPSTLLNQPSVQTMFEAVVREGAKEASPLMLSDTERTPPHLIYLLPPPALGMPKEGLWTNDLLKAMRAFAPSSVGLYFAPEILPAPANLRILNEVLAAMIDAELCFEYYLLRGSLDQGVLLNSALRLKNDLRERQVDLAVFH